MDPSQPDRLDQTEQPDPTDRPRPAGSGPATSDSDEATQRPAAAPLPTGHPLLDGRTAGSPLVRAMRGERTRQRPVWFMRQAGRSLPEYRKLRAEADDTSMLAACLHPELATEITLQPVRRHGVDAAVFFSDIVIPLKLAGIDVEIVAGRGPVLADPIRSAEQVAALPELDPATLEPISQAVAGTVAELGGTPLIGFAGAPFTVASYLVEGGPSRDHLYTKAMMVGAPQVWDQLAGWVARTTAAFLRAQIMAGASAVQLFDSWAGHLSRSQYRIGAAPHSAAVFRAVADLPVPKVHFGVGTGELLADMHTVGADMVGVDHRVDLSDAADRLSGSVPLQGNIDPAMLFAGRKVLHRHTEEVLRSGAAAPGHVVNLGHGVPPNADPSVLTELVEFVHSNPDPAADD